MLDEGFAAYTVRGEGLLILVEDIVMQFIMMYDDKASVTAAQSVAYWEVLREALKILRLGVVSKLNINTSYMLIQISVPDKYDIIIWP